METTNRLGTCDHNVVYYKECKNEEDIDISESIVLSKLREQANRVRFIYQKIETYHFLLV